MLAQVVAVSQINFEGRYFTRKKGNKKDHQILNADTLVCAFQVTQKFWKN